MAQLTFQDKDAIVKFPKQLISSLYVQEFLEQLQLETIVEKSQLTEDLAWELSEELKSEWWKKNRETFLTRIAL